MTRDECKAETQTHIDRVRELLKLFVVRLAGHARGHDQSKLADPELDVFTEFTPKLKELTYGSPEYKAALAGMTPALDHHYANNAHHPEHHSCGVNGMDLLDVVEMLMDWTAASERHADGDIRKSLQMNQMRFDMSPQLAQILHNTITAMGLAP